MYKLTIKRGYQMIIEKTMTTMYRLHTGWTQNSQSPVTWDSRAHVSKMSRDITSNELTISYPQSVSIKTQSKHEPSNKSHSNIWLRNQWDLISSPSLSTSNDFSQLLLITRSPSVIFSSMSPFSEMDYQIRWWNSLQLSHTITGISCLPSDSILAWSS
jgi:hypothetical protein